MTSLATQVVAKIQSACENPAERELRFRQGFLCHLMNLDELKKTGLYIKKLNMRLRDRRREAPVRRAGRLQKVLVANRGEIAKRFFFALHEEGIRSVAVVTDADIGQSWYEFADETMYIGDPGNYTNIAVIIMAALRSGANAIYPGYGFLSEDVRFVESMRFAGEHYGRELIFMGPSAETMRKVGNKLAARKLALDNAVPVFAGSDRIRDHAHASVEAEKIGYPVLLKLDAGGGGKGMTPVFQQAELEQAIESTQRIGRNLYKDDSYYLEKLIQKPVHIEVQIFNKLAIGIRKCAVQRRNQKIIEESGHTFLEKKTCEELLAAAENMAAISGYHGGGAGTVEFLYDADSGKFGFLEMNTRLQVEYAVTDQSLGVDVAKWQIRWFDGRESEIPTEHIRKNRLKNLQHAIECRVYAEDPANNYAPSPGLIEKLDLPTFNGVRNDFGFREGDRILQHYDPMIGKIVCRGENRTEAILRLERALQEIYIKGLHTNIKQLLKIIRHPGFLDPDYTNQILPENPELERVDQDVDSHGDRRITTPPVFAAFVVYASELRRRASQLAEREDNDNILNNRDLTDYSNSFRVEHAGRLYNVEILQRSINAYYAYVDGRFNGRLSLAAPLRDDDDLLVNFGNRSIRIRADRRAGQMILRVKDASGKTQYYRVRIDSTSDKDQDRGLTRIKAPFQSIFVKLGQSKSGEPLKIGSVVETGDALFIISAMKMETTISADVSGTLVQLIEEGELSRLILGKTPDGKILGRSVQEGELLAVIDSGETRTESGEKTANREADLYFDDNSPSILDNIYNKKLKQIFFWNPQRNLLRVIKLLGSHLYGFIPHTPLIDRLADIIKNLAEERLLDQIHPTVRSEIIAILNRYTTVKRVFSPIVSGDLPHFIELSLYVSRLRRERFTPSYAFKNLISTLIDAYDVKGIARFQEDEPTLLESVFFHIHKSYYACQDRKDLVRHLVEILGYSTTPDLETRKALRELMTYEMSELDDSLVETVRGVANRLFPQHGLDSLEMLPAEVSNLVQGDPLTRFPGIEREQLLRSIRKSLLSDPIDPQTFSLSARNEALRKKLIRLSEDNEIQALYSPIPEVHVFLLHPRDRGRAKHYVSFSFPYDDEATTSNAELLGTQRLWQGAIDSLWTLLAYQSVEHYIDNRIEILAEGGFPSVSLFDIHSDKINYWRLYQSLDFKFSELLWSNVDSALIHFGDKAPGAPGAILSLARRSGQLRFEILPEADPSNPYCTLERKTPPADLKLYNRGKWPVDQWMRITFDPQTFEELKIPSIDEIEWTDPKSGHKTVRPVGARIYRGNIEGGGAVFFMKDSRISGGATGDLEGLKFVAAAYYAYCVNLPLYIWNDGAGANIRQGVVSLNRAAQGFMMNALLAQNIAEDEFRRYVDNALDARLQQVLQEVDRIFGFTARNSTTPRRPLFTVAIGVGSSAGLDVYGSSQATLQVLLDSEESYRVLTGSNVIKSVMAEDITNYEIGGARVMGNWTGIADFIARDKVHLICIIRRLHVLFSRDDSETQAVRQQAPNPRALSGASEGHVINESVVCSNVDRGDFWSLKEEYYGAGSIVGGFARVGGSRTLILGARSQYGFRSFPALTRARELLKIANRTRSNRILIFGKRFIARAMHDQQGMRPRIDFLKDLQQNAAIQVNMLTHFDGFHHADINSTADVVIFVNEGDLNRPQQNYVNRNATFKVDSLADGFALCARLFNEFSQREFSESCSAPTETPTIPEDATQPFDMVENVIKRVVDSDSFLEYFAAMNDPHTGPCLITGTARLNGRIVGIIADQPAFMGGAPDAPGTEKFRIFTELLARRNLPVIMLSNAPGFVPGARQERLRIQAVGAESLDVNILSRMPVVSVVLNQNFGGRQIHAFSKFLRPGIVYLALERAQIAVMGARAAFDLFEGQKLAELHRKGDAAAASDLQQKFFEQYESKARASNDAVRTDLVDWIIPNISELREHLLKGLVEADKRTRRAFGRD